MKIEKSNNTSLSHMPNSCLVHVVQFLNPEDCSSFARTSKQNHKASQLGFNIYGKTMILRKVESLYGAIPLSKPVEEDISVKYHDLYKSIFVKLVYPSTTTQLDLLNEIKKLEKELLSRIRPYSDKESYIKFKECVTKEMLPLYCTLLQLGDPQVQKIAIQHILILVINLQKLNNHYEHTFCHRPTIKHLALFFKLAQTILSKEERIKFVKNHHNFQASYHLNFDNAIYNYTQKYLLEKNINIIKKAICNLINIIKNYFLIKKVIDSILMISAIIVYTTIARMWNFQTLLGFPFIEFGLWQFDELLFDMFIIIGLPVISMFAFFSNYKLDDGLSYINPNIK